MTVLEPPIDPAAPTPPPSYTRGLLFRFGFLYWVLFCTMIVGQDLEEYGWEVPPFTSAWHALMRWIGVELLAIPHVATAITGSGDRTADWIGLLFITVVATVGSVVWSLVDRQRRHDERLRDIERVIVRYMLAFVILTYGAAKVFIHQFPAPGASRLLQRYGDSSPMGLVWTFMGASPAYVFFSGAAETVGAALLLFRRTTTLGALVLAVVLTNVVLLNFCYDVPLKLNASHYLAMCVLLLLPDLRRLADLLVLHRPTQPSLRTLDLRRRWMRVTRRILKYGGIAIVVALTLTSERSHTAAGTVHPWYEGYWKVTSFARDGQPVPALVTDETRWQRIRFQILRDDEQYVRWRGMDDSLGDLYTVAVDDARGEMRFTPSSKEPATHPTGPLRFAFTHHGDDLTLSGAVAGHALAVSLHRIEPDDMLLVSRGFHWISEQPYNR